jgi:hypothetical protein
MSGSDESTINGFQIQYCGVGKRVKKKSTGRGMTAPTEERSIHTSYIASVNILSNMDLKPRAPVFFAIALLAISRKAFSVKCNLT